MSVELAEIPDVEGAVMSYLRAFPLVTATPVGTRTYLAVKTPAFPYIVVTRLGGPAAGGTGDLALMQIDVYGRVGALQETSDIRRAVRAALLSLEGAPYVSVGRAALLGATIRDDRRFPESDAQDSDGTLGERPRYIITASVYAVGA